MVTPAFMLQALPILAVVMAALGFVVYRLMRRFKPSGSGGGVVQADGGPESTALAESGRRRVCEAEVAAGGHRFAARAKSITAAGAFLACDDPLPLGETLELTLRLPMPVRLKAVVTWNNRGVPATEVVSRGMRVRFLDLSAEARSAIEALGAL